MGRFLIILLAGATVAGGLRAQPAAPAPGAERPAPPRPAPPALTAHTPVDFFRDLLAMKPAERETVLASRSPQSRGFVEAKVKEFDALPPAAREAQLQTLQLRWYMLPLMKMPPAQRGSRLAAMSEADRRLVEERLEYWDRLPADLQKKVLTNENVIRLIFRSETNAPAVDLFPPTLTPRQREQMEKDQARWNALPEEERREILGQFEHCCELNEAEKARILNIMSDTERRLMEAALRSFSRLPKPQREICIRGLQKFTALPPEEQQEFLVNAERWQSMNAKDRQLWRDLVSRLQPKPPLPPGVQPKGPPLPPGAVRKPSTPMGTAQATN